MAPTNHSIHDDGFLHFIGKSPYGSDSFSVPPYIMQGNPC